MGKLRSLVTIILNTCKLRRYSRQFGLRSESLITPVVYGRLVLSIVGLKYKGSDGLFGRGGSGLISTMYGSGFEESGDFGAGEGDDGRDGTRSGGEDRDDFEGPAAGEHSLPSGDLSGVDCPLLTSADFGKLPALARSGVICRRSRPGRFLHEAGLGAR